MLTISLYCTSELKIELEPNMYSYNVKTQTSVLDFHFSQQLSSSVVKNKVNKHSFYE